MKNRKQHFLTFLFLLLMVLIFASTSRLPPEPPISNSISYENRGDFFLIKIKTQEDPVKYRLAGDFTLDLEKDEDQQGFSINESGEYITWFGYREEISAIPRKDIYDSFEEKVIVTFSKINDGNNDSYFEEIITITHTNNGYSEEKRTRTFKINRIDFDNFIDERRISIVINVSNEDMSTFVEDEYFIIQIRNDIIKGDNPRVYDYITLATTAQDEEYFIGEDYAE